MKGTLEFTMPEERYEFNLATNAADTMSSVHEALDIIRSRLKYNDDVSEVEAKVLESLRETLLAATEVRLDA